MDIEILSKRKNMHLSRVEIRFEIRHPGEPTPTREVVQGAIANILGVKKDAVVIDRVASVFGSGSSRGYAKIYPSREMCMRIERRPILRRNNIIIEESEKGAPAEGSPSSETGTTGGVGDRA